MRLGHPPDARGVAARAQFMTAPKAEKFARKNPVVALYDRLYLHLNFNKTIVHNKRQERIDNCPC